MQQQQETRPKKLLFVCAGNTSRSPMAEVVAKHQLASTGVQIKSAGIDISEGDEYIIPYAACVINKEYGIDLTGIIYTCILSFCFCGWRVTKLSKYS